MCLSRVSVQFRRRTELLVTNYVLLCTFQEYSYIISVSMYQRREAAALFAFSGTVPSPRVIHELSRVSPYHRHRPQEDLINSSAINYLQPLKMMNIDTQQLCNSNSSSPHDEATTTMSNAMAPRTPKSIFRQPTIGSTEADTISGLGSSSTPSSSSSSATSIGIPIPAHWPIARSPLTTHFTPRFADDPITSTHYRPRTPPEDVPRWM